MDLTDRQRELLKCIVELHARNGDPVGSENIDKEFNLGVSPATIRNEMVRLTELGYLKQPHTSAGRVPTALSFRLYINELMKEKSMSVAAEVSIKEALWQQRHREEKLLRQAVKVLASRSGLISLAVDQEGDIYYAGAANILDWPEFTDIDVTRFVLSLFDEFPTLQQILGRAVGSEPMHVIFGEELEFEFLEPTGFVFCRYVTPNGKDGIIGVVGPARMDFANVIPHVRYTSQMVSQMLNGY